MIVLDTCALLWLDSNRGQFSESASQALHEHADSLAVSPVSFMEIGIKQRRGRLRLPQPLPEWVKGVCDRYSLVMFSVSRDIAVAATSSSDIHRDPFYGIIIATAKLNALNVITADRIFKKNKDIEVLW